MKILCQNCGINRKLSFWELLIEGRRLKCHNCNQQYFKEKMIIKLLRGLGIFLIYLCIVLIINSLNESSGNKILFFVIAILVGIVLDVISTIFLAYKIKKLQK